MKSWGYTLGMKWTRHSSVIAILVAVFALGAPPLIFGAETTLTTPDGEPVLWSDWVAENAPVAVLLWVSWVPGADETVADLDRITSAARAHDLDLVVVAVQEPLEEATEILDSANVNWLHDRFGHLLKDHRVVTIPRLLVFEKDGRVVEQLEVSRNSLRSWAGE